MSLLHRRDLGGRTLEVRSARATRRLYVDGVLHTSYSPVRPLTGAVWDPLALAGFLVPEAPAGEPRVREALVLGVGGGAALHLLRRHLSPRRIVGIEAEPQIADVARDWFDLSGPGIEVVVDDARAWVQRRSRPRFDLIVDDVFGEVGGEPARDERLVSGWWARLARLLTPRGVLVVNFPTLPDLFGSAVCQDVSLRPRFPCALHFSFEQYENAIVALCSEPVTPQRFRRVLALIPSLRGARRMMNFRVHRLWPA